MLAQPPRARPSEQTMAASAQHQPEVRLVATDVDGTLLSSDQQLLPRVQSAVQRSVELGVPVCRCLPSTATKHQRRQPIS